MTHRELAGIFNGLEGIWTLNRYISPQNIQMEGRAIFSRISEICLQYKENGYIPHTQTDFQRRYTWHLDELGIYIEFADGPDTGKLFHRLEFTSSQNASGSHLCQQDKYATLYQFNLPQSMRIEHIVKGPQKDYVSHTDFRKINTLGS